MEKELSRDDKDLLGIRDSMSRMLKTDDGKTTMMWLEYVVGYEFPLPEQNIQKANGARGIVCMMKNMVKDTPVKDFLNHCKEHYSGGKLTT